MSTTTTTTAALLVDLRARRDELQEEVRNLREAEAEWKALQEVIATSLPTTSSSPKTPTPPAPIVQPTTTTTPSSSLSPPSPLSSVVVVGDAATEDVLDKVVRGMTTYATDGAYPHWACWPLLQPSRVQAYASCFDLSGTGTPLIRVDDVWNTLMGNSSSSKEANKHDITRCYSRGFFEPLSNPLSWAKTAVCGRSVPFTADGYDVHRKAESKRLKQLKKASKGAVDPSPNTPPTAALPTSHMTLSVTCESKAGQRGGNKDGDSGVVLPPSAVVELMGIRWTEHIGTTDMVSFREGVHAATTRVKNRILEYSSSSEEGGGDAGGSTYLGKLVQQLTGEVIVTSYDHNPHAAGEATKAATSGGVQDTTTQNNATTAHEESATCHRVHVVLRGPIDLLCAMRDPSTHKWQAPAASIIRHWISATEELVASNKTTAIPSLMLLLRGLATTYDPFTMSEKDMVSSGVEEDTTPPPPSSTSTKEARRQKHSQQRLKSIAGFFSSKVASSSTAEDEGDANKQILAESMPIFFQGMAACGARLDLAADLPMLSHNEPIASVLQRAAQEVCAFYDMDSPPADTTTAAVPTNTFPTWKFDITNVPLKYWLKWVSIKQKLERERGGPGRAARSAAAASVSVGLNLYSRLMLHCYRPTYTAIKKMCPSAAATAHEMLGVAKESVATLVASGAAYIRTLSSRSKLESPMLSEVVRGMTSGVTTTSTKGPEKTTPSKHNSAARDEISSIPVRMWQVGLDVAVPVSPAMFNEGDGKQPPNGDVDALAPKKEWRYVVAHMDATLTH